MPSRDVDKLEVAEIWMSYCLITGSLMGLGFLGLLEEVQCPPIGTVLSRPSWSGQSGLENERTWWLSHLLGKLGRTNLIVDQSIAPKPKMPFSTLPPSLRFTPFVRMQFNQTPPLTVSGY